MKKLKIKFARKRDLHGKLESGYTIHVQSSPNSSIVVGVTDYQAVSLLKQMSKRVKVK